MTGCKLHLPKVGETLTVRTWPYPTATTSDYPGSLRAFDKTSLETHSQSMCFVYLQ